MKQRLHYFDMLKGLAIFMVVMGHVIAFCVREIDRAAIFKMIGSVHMPLFFFISGWMSWRGGRRPDLVKRSLQLLVPMLACSTLWIYYFPHSGLESPLSSSFDGLWHDYYKNGYWFTLVLFEIIVVYTPFSLLLRRLRGLAASLAAVACMCAAVLLVDFMLMSTPMSGLLSWHLVTQFSPVFAMGVLACKYKERFYRLVRSELCVTAAFLVGAAAMYVCSWPWEFPPLAGVLADYGQCLLHLCLAVVAVAVVKPWSEEAYAPGAQGHALARMWSYIGRESLGVYLLHYFFLFPLGAVRPLLESTALGFVPVAAVSMAVAAAVVAVVLGVVRLLRPSALLSWLLAGRLPNFNKDNKASVCNE